MLCVILSIVRVGSLLLFLLMIPVASERALCHPRALFLCGHEMAPWPRRRLVPLQCDIRTVV